MYSSNVNTVKTQKNGLLIKRCVLLSGISFYYIVVKRNELNSGYHGACANNFEVRDDVFNS